MIPTMSCGHFHYVLSMGALFGIIGGYYHWSPKIIGYTYREKLGKLQFIILFIGVNITFLPMHWLGLSGMPRRYADYPDNYLYWNKIISYGSIISIGSVIVITILIYKQYTNKNREKERKKYSRSIEEVINTPPEYETYRQIPVTGRIGIEPI